VSGAPGAGCREVHELLHGVRVRAYRDALTESATFLDSGLVGMRYGQPGETVPSEKVTEIVMVALHAHATRLREDAVKLATAYADTFMPKEATDG